MTPTNEIICWVFASDFHSFAGIFAWDSTHFLAFSIILVAFGGISWERTFAGIFKDLLEDLLGLFNDLPGIGLSMSRNCWHFQISEMRWSFPEIRASPNYLAFFNEAGIFDRSPKISSDFQSLGQFRPTCPYLKSPHLSKPTTFPAICDSGLRTLPRIFNDLPGMSLIVRCQEIGFKLLSSSFSDVTALMCSYMLILHIGPKGRPLTTPMYLTQKKQIHSTILQLHAVSSSLPRSLDFNGWGRVLIQSSNPSFLRPILHTPFQSDGGANFQRGPI
jgi:hypothetical protein